MLVSLIFVLTGCATVDRYAVGPSLVTPQEIGNGYMLEVMVGDKTATSLRVTPGTKMVKDFEKYVEVKYPPEAGGRTEKIGVGTKVEVEKFEVAEDKAFIQFCFDKTQAVDSADELHLPITNSYCLSLIEVSFAIGEWFSVVSGNPGGEQVPSYAVTTQSQEIRQVGTAVSNPFPACKIRVLRVINGRVAALPPATR